MDFLQFIHYMIAEQSGQTDEQTVLKAVVLISRQKRYQTMLMIFLGIVFHLMNISMLSQPFLFPNPTFLCEGAPATVSEDDACPILEFCRVDNPLSLTAQLEVYCDGRKDDRNLLQSINGMGSIFGVLLVNWLADRKGKRFCMILCCFLAAIYAYISLVGILHQSVELVVISQFLIGFAYGAFSTLCFFMGSRYLSDLSDYVVLFFYLCGTGTGQLTIAFISAYFPGWQAYQAINIVGFTLTAIIAPFIVKDDPVYLYNNSQMDELNHLVESVGKSNGATVQQMQEAENELSRINKFRGKRTPQMAQLIPAGLRNKTVILLIVVMVCCSFANNAVYYGIGFQIDKFGFSVTGSLFIFGMVEIINYLGTMAMMAYLPCHRTILYVTALIPTLFCLSFFLEEVTHSTLLQMAATAITRFFVTTYGCFYITYYIRRLPKQVEGTAAGLIEGLGNLGKVVAPYSVRIAAEQGVNAMVVFGFIFFLTGFLPLLFLPKDGQAGDETDEYEIVAK